MVKVIRFYTVVNGGFWQFRSRECWAQSKVLGRRVTLEFRLRCGGGQDWHRENNRDCGQRPGVSNGKGRENMIGEPGGRQNPQVGPSTDWMGRSADTGAPLGEKFLNLSCAAGPTAVKGLGATIQQSGTWVRILIHSFLAGCK